MKESLFAESNYEMDNDSTDVLWKRMGRVRVRR